MVTCLQPCHLNAGFRVFGAQVLVDIRDTSIDQTVMVPTLRESALLGARCGPESCVFSSQPPKSFSGGL